MRRACHIVLLALLLTGCQLRPLTDPSNVSYVRVYVHDTGIKNLTTGVFNSDFVRPDYQKPEVLRVALYDSYTGNLAAERYLRNQGDDALGHYYDGYIVAAPGKYSLRAYNFGTESTIVGNEYNWYEAYAYTNQVSPSLTTKFKGATRVTDGSKAGEATRSPDEPIRWDPDPFFVANATDIVVPVHQSLDTLKTVDNKAYFDAGNVVKEYFLQVGVSGVEYVSSTVALLTGMASSMRLYDGDISAAEPATLYLEMKSGSYPDGVYKGLNDYHCIYCTFGTFGRLDSKQNLLQLSFEFATIYGVNYEVSLDVEPEFLKEDATDRQWLLIDKIISIPEPPEQPASGGGLLPSVYDWDDINSEIVI